MVSESEEENQQVKEWMSQLRELSYDAEDCVDEFMHSLARGDTCDGFIQNISSKVITLLHAIYEDKDKLVGIGNLVDILVKQLTDDIDLHPHRMVVSIVGLGGLGKTTLANQVFKKIKTQFHCTAFVPVSRSPNITKILSDALLQVLESSSKSTADQRGDHIANIKEDLRHEALEYLQIVNMIREYLQNKRVHRERMVGVTASALMGVMNPLLGRLSSLLEREDVNLKGVHRKIIFLRDELSSMSTTLEMVSESEEASSQVKEWMGQLRELSYDVEDCIEIFTHHLDRVATCEGFIQKIISKVITLKAHYHIGIQINELKERVMEVSDRRKRYRIDPSTLFAKSVAIDPRLPALFEEADRLVGIDGQMDKLVQLLSDGIGLHTQRKVVSIVGFGGLGKTTLANQVFQKVRSQFDCTAFVSVTRSPNVNFSDTLLQFLKSCPITADQNQDIARVQEDLYLKTLEYPQLVNMNRDCLQNKRYAIIHERNMSFMIFYHKDDYPLELKEVTDDILRKCHGLPLAIVNIASLLATKPISKREWERVRNSLGSALEQDHELELVKRILFLSYCDLPHYLKICFLYLSIFPEDHVIGRLCLIRKWIAEGFIAEQQGQYLEDTAENYFSELINRNMIEPVGNDYSGRSRACRVHDIMLDLIISLSVKENFVAIMADHKLTLSTNKIRRLSLQGNCAEQSLCLGANSFSQVRSFTVFGDVRKIPPLLNFHNLRVLDIQNCPSLEDRDIENIGSLSHLRYISLYNSNIGKIPSQIGRLQHLQTLDLRATRIKELPATIAQLHQLVRICVPNGVELPKGIGNMIALEELSMLDASKTPPEVVQELGNLTKLKVLGIKWCADNAINDEGGFKKSLISSFCNLGERNLNSLRIETTERCSMDFLFDSLCPHPCHMQTFRNSPTFARLPKWISYLSVLTNLVIFIEDVGGGDVDVLKDLPALRCLQIFTTEYLQESLTISPKGFQCLEDFHFRPSMYSKKKKGVTSLIFEAGAMPRLNRLWFRFVVHDTLSTYGVDFDFGISLLSSLKCLWVSINCRGAMFWEVEAAKATITNAAALLPNRPRHAIHIFGEEGMVEDEEQKDSGTADQPDGSPT
ncbi:Disease resistance protein RPM1 [Dichanthelium oligosanthes]|uniref:Disease resistance protein RPM1 n=1 Tax=Dichanthelium oligosanthes TaxID=888268 RepID=A0A1E5VSF6_9POAL|nr:Disease resistance protein RPM1 [Dichanthelium oligosanthes]